MLFYTLVKNQLHLGIIQEQGEGVMQLNKFGKDLHLQKWISKANNVQKGMPHDIMFEVF